MPVLLLANKVVVVGSREKSRHADAMKSWCYPEARR